MALIVFRVFPQVSHHNATFALAKQLLKKRHRIIYVGNGEMEGLVKGNGLEYFVLQTDIFPRIQPHTNQNNFYFILKNFKSRKNLFKKLHNDYLQGHSFDEIVNQFRPDLVIVDSPFVRHAISLFPRKVKFVIIESMVSRQKDSFKPPLNSSIVPRNSAFSKLIIQLAWLKYFAKNRLRHLTGHVMPSRFMIKKFCKKIKFPYDKIDMNRYLHPGLSGIPELILSPEEFDFPHSKKINQYHIGPTIDLNRNDEMYDLRYFETINQISKVKVDRCSYHTRHEFTIYCSFGSAAWRYSGVTSFYDKLITIFRKQSNWKLILSIGTELDYKILKSIPDNVYVFQMVPQTDVLKRVDIMITHGGMNSITECILANVPMLVIPGTKLIDQVGNAARVKYHGMGLVGNLKWTGERRIKNKIIKLLSNSSYFDSVYSMREKIYKNKNYEKGADIVELILNQDIF